MSSTADFLIPIPASPAEAAPHSWDDLKSYYDRLAELPLTRDNVESWLATWSWLEAVMSETASLAMIAYTCDTADPGKQATHLRWSAEIMPRAEEESVRLARRLVDSGLEPPGLETTVRRFRTAIGLFRQESVPLFTELEELGAEYQRITGSMMADWEGRRVPLPQLAPFLERPERDTRERAFRAGTEPYVASRNELADLFQRMYVLRQQVAVNAGFANFRDYIFPAKFRFDYTPADCERFQDAVERSVVPAIRRLNAERRTRLGLETLRPWDLQLNPYRPDSFRPYDNPVDLPRIALRMFERVDAALGAQFRTLLVEGGLDLESRKGKAPGGYCDTLHVRGRPFIFMNASGVMDDVTTLLHEAGHAFHAFAAHRLPYIWQRHPGAEAAELASMSMELLAGAHLARPVGFLAPGDAQRARLERLEETLLSLAHIASVDAFQHWIYASGEGGDTEARNAAWLRIRDRFEPDVDWDGLDRERVARWYRQLHLFLYPFYYIEYGIAQLGALQVWRNSLRDPAAALAGYRSFLGLGATRPLPQLYAAAGAELIFDAEGMTALVALVEDQAAALRATLLREVAPSGATGEIGRD